MVFSKQELEVLSSLARREVREAIRDSESLKRRLANGRVSPYKYSQLKATYASKKAYKDNLVKTISSGEFDTSSLNAIDRLCARADMKLDRDKASLLRSDKELAEIAVISTEIARKKAELEAIRNKCWGRLRES